MNQHGSTLTEGHSNNAQNGPKRNDDINVVTVVKVYVQNVRIFVQRRGCFVFNAMGQRSESTFGSRMCQANTPINLPALLGSRESSLRVSIKVIRDVRVLILYRSLIIAALIVLSWAKSKWGNVQYVCYRLGFF